MCACIVLCYSGVLGHPGRGCVIQATAHQAMPMDGEFSTAILAKADPVRVTCTPHSCWQLLAVEVIEKKGLMAQLSSMSSF